jgi:hypothetical protein
MNNLLHTHSLQTLFPWNKAHVSSKYHSIWRFPSISVSTLAKYLFCRLAKVSLCIYIPVLIFKYFTKFLFIAKKRKNKNIEMNRTYKKPLLFFSVSTRSTLHSHKWWGHGVMNEKNGAQRMAMANLHFSNLDSVKWPQSRRCHQHQKNIHWFGGAFQSSSLIFHLFPPKTCELSTFLQYMTESLFFWFCIPVLLLLLLCSFCLIFVASLHWFVFVLSLYFTKLYLQRSTTTTSKWTHNRMNDFGSRESRRWSRQLRCRWRHHCSRIIEVFLKMMPTK